MKIYRNFPFLHGTLEVSQDFTFKNDDDTLIVVDTSMTAGEYINSTNYQNISKYDQKIVFNSDRVTFEDNDGRRVYYLFSNIEKDYDKESLYTAISEIYDDTITKIVIFLVLFITLFVRIFFNQNGRNHIFDLTYIHCCNYIWD